MPIHRNPSRTGDQDDAPPVEEHEATVVPEPVAASESPAPAPAIEPVTPTRASAAWTSLAAAFILGVLLVIFILQNMTRARIHFVGLNARLPIAVAILIATLVGAGVSLLIGAVRIHQLRQRITRR